MVLVVVLIAVVQPLNRFDALIKVFIISSCKGRLCKYDDIN